ncbi:nose resistant to fluoxetine protein 6 [Drosophila kikkawai]|uniref:Nose resistant to fluoxetine protein 6 n=1 Tax=Drosophila kikkawai TaxID=30033 RepID=A0A6P4ILV4_DROKI|nr:nose resistant to fluoxetine protein 6 [Drosophila kikkawai]
MLIAVLLLVQVLAVLGDGQTCAASKSLLMDLLEVVPPRGNHTAMSQCEKQLEQLRDAVQKDRIWALRALDASGEGFNDFIIGQSQWLGSQFACRSTNQLIHQKLIREDPRPIMDLSPFPLDYMVAYIQAYSPYRVIPPPIRPEPMLHIGLCVPQTCGIAEVESLIRRALVKGTSSFQRWEMQPQLAYTKRPKLSPDFYESRAVRILAAVVSITLLLGVLATSGLHRYSRYMACFDLASNWERAWQPVDPRQENRAINGIRVITAFALIGVHVIWYKYFSVDPSLEMLEKIGTMSVNHNYWPNTVELFFVISGYLTVTKFLRDEQLQRDIAGDGLWGNGRRFLRLVMHRFWRLAPMQFVVMVTAVVAVEYQRQVSVMEISEPTDLRCHRHWLRNVFFVQNLFPLKELCGSWTWSLACEMQLHILALVLLFGHTRHPRSVLGITCMLAIVSLLFPAVMTHLFEVGTTFEDFFNTGEWSYVCPLTRLLGYLTGCAYAYTQVKGLDTPFEMIVPGGWIRGFLGGGLLWLIQLFISDQLAVGIILIGLLSVLRVLVAAFASYLMVCSEKEDTKDTNDDLYAPIRWLLTVLQSEHLQRMSRFTFAIYLLNPVVIVWFYHSFSASFNPDTSLLILLIIAESVVTYILAIGVTLLFEMPYNRLTSLVIKSSSLQRQGKNQGNER